MILPPCPAPFWFNARVLEWHDGDTGRFQVDRGDRDYSVWAIRLLGCNARELSMPGGVEARDALRLRMPVGTAVTLATVAPDKYGDRKDAQVVHIGPDGSVHDLVADLIADEWAAPWTGLGTQPVPPWPRSAA